MSSDKVRTGLQLPPTPSLQPVALWNNLPLGPVGPDVSKPDKGLEGSACPRAEEGAMLRNRFLIVLSGCLLAASAAWADDVGYIECSNHPEGTQVFGKPRKTPEVVVSLP